MNLTKIKEQPIQETTLQVYHRQLKVPEDVYIESINYSNPWDERAYQEFVEKYLQEIKDTGIVGMVRMHRTTGFVYFDAAIRYEQN